MNFYRIPREAAAELPFNKVRSAMERARAENLPNLPKSLSELRDVLKDDRYQYLTKTLEGNDSV